MIKEIRLVVKKSKNYFTRVQIMEWSWLRKWQSLD